jgi:protein-serine/threonine kinase
VDPTFSQAQEFGGGVDANGMQASTSKARKVMQWFRTKSKGRDSIGFGAEEDSEVPSSSKEKGGTPTQAKYRRGFSASSSTVNHSATTTSLGLNEVGMAPVKVVVTTPNSTAPVPPRAAVHAQRSASSATEASPSFVSRFRNSVTVGGSSHHREREADKSHPYGQLRIHHGAVDQMMITTKAPPEVMAHVKKILEGMGVETQLESEYKFRCIRAKKRKGTMGHSAGANASTTTTSGSGLAAVTLVGTAASNGVSFFFFFVFGSCLYAVADMA